VNYIIVSISNSDYQYWQIIVLYNSIKAVNQQGKLVVMCSQESNTTISLPNDIIKIDFPDFSNECYGYKVGNRYKQEQILARDNRFKDSDILLFLDPDMLLLNSIDLVPEENTIIGQSFINEFIHQEGFNIEVKKAIRYPFVTNFKTFKSYIDDMVIFSNIIYNNTKNWQSDMYGLVYSVTKQNINIIELPNFGICNDWDIETKDIKNIIHYCQPIYYNNDILFFKHSYFNTEDLDKEVEGLSNINKILKEKLKEYKPCL
jgi:hypothetical protein